MVISAESSSQLPALPFFADALTVPNACRLPCEEVSPDHRYRRSTALRANLTMEVGVALMIAQPYRRYPAALQKRQCGAALHHHLVRITDVAVLTLPAATDIHFTAALTTGRCDVAALVQQIFLTLHDNLTTLTGRIVACRYHSGAPHHCRHRPVQCYRPDGAYRWLPPPRSRSVPCSLSIPRPSAVRYT